MTGTLQRLIALFLLACPTALFALGLGDIRLNSALNEPLDAEIELVGAAPDELTSLRATLANPEAFTRYGLERSAFLSKIEFKVGQGRDGRPALLVRSRESVPDPFLTLLVDVNWSRGRLLREYTMLLDPPVYTPGAEQAASAPVSAPQAGDTESPRSGSVQRTPEPPAQAAPASGVSRAPDVPSGISAGSDYTVRNNDTLWRIASGLKPGASSDVNRMMMAIYRSNPAAFSGNINDLHAGAILRLPSDTEFEAIGGSEASAEVRRQYAEWRANRGVAASGTPPGERLRLVTPTEGGEGAATQTGASAAQSQELRDKVQELQTQLDESRRMLQLKDAELAKLQQKVGQPAEPAPTPTPAPTETPTPAPTETQPAPTETPPEATTTPPVEPQPTPAEQQPKPPEAAPQAPVEEQPSILDWVIAHWYYALAALLILILLWLAARRRRHEPDFSKLGRLADAARTGAAREPRIDREPVTTAVRATRPADDAFLVEESGERPQPKIAKVAEPARAERPKAEPARKSADDTLSSETAINLDQGDPLAEADFHMAYGLYDQAADLVRIAIEREPKRRDLKLKLLEIFFVWGNKDAFLQAARELAQTRQDAGPGEWEKIAIMGRQISPEDPMFAQAPGTAGAAAADVDLNLEGGENRVDLDLLGPPEGEGGGAIDLDLGTAGGDDSSVETGESVALKDEGLDFPLEDQPTRISDGSATTREMTARSTMETPTIESETYRSGEVPTVESPTLRGRDSPTIKEKIDSALFRKDDSSPDQTAELALDDLGLELDELAAAQSDPLEETDHPSNAPTMLAGLDEKSRRLLAEAEARRGRLADEDDTKISPTGTWVLEDKTMAATMALPGAPERDTSATTARNRALSGDGTGETARRRKSDSDATAEMPPRSGGDEMDLDLDQLEAALTSDTIKQPPRKGVEEDRFASDVFGAKDLAATDLDLDVGEVKHDRDRTPTGTARIPAEEMALPELEPVTMSEVGTKLDLARAYMDMGDPEGARSILEEVLQEGSATQKQEAQRLIESLPG